MTAYHSWLAVLLRVWLILTMMINIQVLLRINCL